MSNSVGEAISKAILAHANQKPGGDPLWQVIEDAIRKEFDVKRREAWIRNPHDNDAVTLATKHLEG